ALIAVLAGFDCRPLQLCGQSEAGDPADAADGDCGHLYEAAAEPGGRGTRDLSVSLARRADRAGQPCVEHRYEVYPLAAGVCLSGGGDRLVQSVRTVLGLIDHAGWRLLPGGT